MGSALFEHFNTESQSTTSNTTATPPAIAGTSHGGRGRSIAGGWQALDRGIVADEQPDPRPARAELDRSGSVGARPAISVTRCPSTYVPFELPRSTSTQPALERAQLGVARARVDVAVRIERDLAVGMSPEPDARLRIELLTLAASATGDVVDHDPHP